MTIDFARMIPCTSPCFCTVTLPSQTSSPVILPSMSIVLALIGRWHSTSHFRRTMRFSVSTLPGILPSALSSTVPVQMIVPRTFPSIRAIPQRMRVVTSPFGITVTVPCVCTVRPKGPVMRKSRRSMYEPHFGHELDSAAEETSCAAPQLKQWTSRIDSREIILFSLSKSDGALRLETSFASSFSIEKCWLHFLQMVDLA